MKRSYLRKTAAAVMAVFSSAFILPMFSEVGIPVSAESVMTTADIVKDMGIGWNLGNSLDSHNQGFYSDNVYDYETQWSNPVVTQSLINKVKEKGFNTIRIPVTWYQHISTDGNYTINPDWMARVKEVVNYAYNSGMYVILNIHHENWINRADFASAGASMEVQLRAVWRQIADEFSDYGQRLIFEGMNEPRAEGAGELEWNGNEACYNVVNQLNQAFVETVRAVDSPYQKTRMLMVPDYAASRESSIYSHLTIPKSANSIDADNDGDDDYVAVSLHAYSPYQFAMGNGDHSSYSAAYEAELESMFSGMQSQFLQEGVQIILGEFSASNYGYDSARLAWAESYMKNATEYGIPCVLWDNNVESNNGGEAHGYINRATEEWYYSGGLVVDKLISARKSNSWGTKTHITYPMYTHNNFSSGSYVPIDTSSGNIYVNNLSGFNSGTELAVKYTGATLPEVGLMTVDWGGWVAINPYDFDKDNKIAYFSYDQIMKAWNSANGALGVIKIKDIGIIGYGGITLLNIPQQSELKITANPSDSSLYYCQQLTLTAAASPENAGHTWYISRDNGASWTKANVASENVKSGNGTTNVTSVFNLKNNSISEPSTVLFKCEFSDGKTTKSTGNARVTVLSRNPALSLRSVNKDSAGISWQAIPYASYYKVYRVVNGQFVQMTSCTGTSCSLTGLSPNTEYEIFVSAVFSDGADVPYNHNSVKFTTTKKSVDEMTIEECIEFVNSINSDEDVLLLTEEQLRAIERVLEYDYSK